MFHLGSANNFALLNKYKSWSQELNYAWLEALLTTTLVYNWAIKGCYWYYQFMTIGLPNSYGNSIGNDKLRCLAVLGRSDPLRELRIEMGGSNSVWRSSFLLERCTSCFFDLVFLLSLFIRMFSIRVAQSYLRYPNETSIGMANWYQ